MGLVDKFYLQAKIMSMVIKRPKKTGSKKEGKKSSTESQLMEHLVKKSLNINPELPDAAQPEQIVKTLRGEAPEKSLSQGSAESPHQRKKALAKRRRDTIAFFFEQKRLEFDESMTVLLQKIALIEGQQDTLKEQTIQALVDFLSLLPGAADSPEAREVMRQHQELLQLLGITDAHISQKIKDP